MLLEGGVEEVDHGEKDEPEISLHALTGWPTAQNMRLTTTIGHFEVMVLIDSDSTHYFVSERVANLLWLLVVPTDHFLVRVANDTPMKHNGRFENVSFGLQGIHFHLTLYALLLIDLDLVLEVQWLSKLRSIVWLEEDDRKIPVAGSVMTTLWSWFSHITVDPFQNHWLGCQQRHSLLAICMTKDKEPDQTLVQAALQKILNDFVDIF